MCCVQSRTHTGPAGQLEVTAICNSGRKRPECEATLLSCLQTGICNFQNVTVHRNRSHSGSTSVKSRQLTRNINNRMHSPGNGDIFLGLFLRDIILTCYNRSRKGLSKPYCANHWTVYMWIKPPLCTPHTYSHVVLQSYVRKAGEKNFLH